MGLKRQNARCVARWMEVRKMGVCRWGWESLLR